MAVGNRGAWRKWSAADRVQASSISPIRRSARRRNASPPLSVEFRRADMHAVPASSGRAFSAIGALGRF
jgi:hypothetical protein